MNKNKVKLTKQGIQELQEELDTLKKTKRPALVARLTNAREQGDLSENSDYISAREELEFMDDRITELEQLLSNVQQAPDTGTGTINMGNTVTLELKKKQITYHIVGEWEADPMAKKISVESPLGKALHDKEVGDVVTVDAPAGKLEYKVLKIE